MSFLHQPLKLHSVCVCCLPHCCVFNYPGSVTRERRIRQGDASPIRRGYLILPGIETWSNRGVLMAALSACICLFLTCCWCGWKVRWEDVWFWLWWRNMVWERMLRSKRETCVCYIKKCSECVTHLDLGVLLFFLSFNASPFCLCQSAVEFTHVLMNVPCSSLPGCGGDLHKSLLCL